MYIMALLLNNFNQSFRLKRHKNKMLAFIKKPSLVSKIEREKDKQASCSLLFCIFEDKSNQLVCRDSYGSVVARWLLANHKPCELRCKNSPNQAGNSSTNFVQSLAKWFIPFILVIVSAKIAQTKQATFRPTSYSLQQSYHAYQQ